VASDHRPPTHDRLVGLLDDPSRRRENFGRPRVHPLVGLVYCASCDGKMTTVIAPKQGRGYSCRKDENPVWVPHVTRFRGKASHSPDNASR
jgi:hypothetical protein